MTAHSIAWHVWQAIIDSRHMYMLLFKAYGDEATKRTMLTIHLSSASVSPV